MPDLEERIVKVCNELEDICEDASEEDPELGRRMGLQQLRLSLGRVFASKGK